LRLLIEESGEYALVGQTDDGVEAVATILKERPDVAVLDVEMPGMNGLEVARRLRAGGYDGGIVMLSAHSEWHRVQGAMRAGADAYVLKVHAFAELRRALDRAVRRESFVSESIAAGGHPGNTARTSVLTTREREVLRLLAEGNSTKEVAYRLGVSVKTAETHRLNLVRKLGVTNIADLTRLALREGLITL